MPRLSPFQARLQDDLRGLIEGEVRCDETTLQLYSTDGGPFSVRPSGVIWPRSKKDIVACLKYAEEKNIPVHPRGAGTGRCGGALGSGFILDFTRHLRRTVEFGEDCVRVQSGAIFSRVNSVLRRSHARKIGPDPGLVSATTLGSWAACDGAGSRWIPYGSPRESVRALEVVLASGEILRLSLGGNESEDSHRSRASYELPLEHNNPLPVDADREKNSRSSLLVTQKTQSYRERVHEILSPALAEIRDAQPPQSPIRCGYRLEGVLRNSPSGTGSPEHVDLGRLFLGSEGTLGILTELTIATVPISAHRGSVFFLFDSLEKAAKSIPLILPQHPARCEMMDRRRINMVRDWDERFRPYLPPETEAVLLVEIEGPHASELDDRLNTIVDSIRFSERLCFGSRVAFDREEILLLRSLIRNGELALARMSAHHRAIPLFDGIMVPVENLPAFFVQVQNIFRKYDVLTSYFGHIGHGHLQIHPIFDIHREKIGDLLFRLSEEVYTEILRQDGSLCCEGAYGLVRSRFLERESPTLFPLFRRIKQLFDPGNLLNPGKIVEHEEEDWNALLRF